MMLKCAKRTNARETRPMNARDLIETAHGLTELSRRRPTQANLRRALSTAYYAVFHCLAATVADALMGKGRGDAWHQTYRALEHGSARRACRNMQAMREFPPEIQDFAETFNDLQKVRHRADYALDGRYNKADVLEEIEVAEMAIAGLEGAALQHRRRFAAHVLFKRRS